MKVNKRDIIIALLFAFALIILLSACGSSTAGTDSKKQVQSDAPQSDNGLKSFTKEELKKFDGQNGNPAYVAVNGKVYDVTGVKAWQGGKHNGLEAGKDLSNEIKKSPHGLKVLDGLKVVGSLSQ